MCERVCRLTRSRVSGNTDGRSDGRAGGLLPRVGVDIACVRVSVDGLRAKWFTDVVKGKPSRQPAACPKSEHADLSSSQLAVRTLPLLRLLGKKGKEKND